jgi:branched-chain amino acid transport system substrate-binding protein
MAVSCVVFAVPGCMARDALFLHAHSMHFRQTLALLVVAAACSHAGTRTVTLGAAGPFSQAYGLANKQGIELAVDEINADPEWSKNHRLEISFADDSGSGARASAIAQNFVDDPRVVAVVGHVNSGAMVSAAHVYDGNLAAVATTATSPALTGISRWTFRVIPSDSANAITIARFVNRLGRKRAAVLYENNAYGRGLAENFRKSFVGDVITVDPIGEGGQQNFEPYVTWFKREKPDVVFVAGTDVSGLAFLKEVRRQHFDVDLVGGDGWQTVAWSPLAEGAYVGAPFSAQDPRAEVQAFVAAYTRKFNVTPDGNAALAYDATKLLAHAIEAVGPDREKIRDYLASLNDSNAYRGVTGSIRFRPDGDPVGKGIVITRVHDGALRVEGGATQ